MAGLVPYKTSEARRTARARYYKKHAEKVRAHGRRRMAEKREQLKRAAVNAYGGRCDCCGTDHLVFLAIDHVGGGGTAHRQSVSAGRGGTTFYRWLRDQDYPPGFRVLCHNCHAGHHSSAGCPCLKTADLEPVVA